jgi:hypothetical protein
MSDFAAFCSMMPKEVLDEIFEYDDTYHILFTKSVLPCIIGGKSVRLFRMHEIRSLLIDWLYHNEKNPWLKRTDNPMAGFSLENIIHVHAAVYEHEDLCDAVYEQNEALRKIESYGSFVLRIVFTKTEVGTGKVEKEGVRMEVKVKGENTCTYFGGKQYQQVRKNEVVENCNKLSLISCEFVPHYNKGTTNPCDSMGFPAENTDDVFGDTAYTKHYENQEYFPNNYKKFTRYIQHYDLAPIVQSIKYDYWGRKTNPIRFPKMPQVESEFPHWYRRSNSKRISRIDWERELTTRGRNLSNIRENLIADITMF